MRVDRLDAASEETLLTLLRQEDDVDEADRRPRLLIGARSEDGGAILEFVASRTEEILQDPAALLAETGAGDSTEQEVSLACCATSHLRSAISNTTTRQS